MRAGVQTFRVLDTLVLEMLVRDLLGIRSIGFLTWSGENVEEERWVRDE